MIAADVNCDGSIDISDILEIRSIIFGGKPPVPTSSLMPTNEPTPTYPPFPTLNASPQAPPSWWLDNGEYQYGPGWLTTISELHIKVGETKTVPVRLIVGIVICDYDNIVTYTLEDNTIVDVKRIDPSDTFGTSFRWSFTVTGKRVGETTVLIHGNYTPTIYFDDQLFGPAYPYPFTTIHETVTIHVTE